MTQLLFLQNSFHNVDYFARKPDTLIIVTENGLIFFLTKKNDTKRKSISLYARKKTIIQHSRNRVFPAKHLSVLNNAREYTRKERRKFTTENLETHGEQYVREYNIHTPTQYIESDQNTECVQVGICVEFIPLPKIYRAAWV